MSEDSPMDDRLKPRASDILLLIDLQLFGGLSRAVLAHVLLWELFDRLLWA
jgi:hypothetical protein